jgi:replicative DNA helicase
MGKDKNFEYLGQTFQLQLINQIIIDKTFGSSIIDVLEVSYFENKYFKIILQFIKEHYVKYNEIPSFSTLKQIIKSELAQDMLVKVAIDTLESVRNIATDGAEFVQEKALKFCKQQELKKVMTKAQKIIDGGEFENYDQVESLVRNALQVGELDRGQLNVFDDAEDVLKEDFRHPVPMGIKGIDNALKGGLAKGEIGVILAPTGVGKSTILTKISNHAYNLGFNVLQVFFEDNPKIIQRKHFTLWTKIKPDNLTDEKEAVLSQIQELKKMENKLILKKLPSETLTMSAIKNQVRKIISEGIKIDLICLDYIDCVLPDRHSGDEWKGEGSVIRAFEAMCHELDIVGWTATQGNRSSISSDVVTNDQMGGSIKKAQVGHVIISIAKSMEQKEAKLATLAITKSRIGTDGIIFKNCKFDNEMLEIDTESSVTLLGHHEEVEQAVELASKKRLAELNSAKVSRVN